jgi:hypothetical protein
MEDYSDAAHRHFEDAKLLHEQEPARLANASHLYGFSGECVLKAIMSGQSGQGVARKHLPDIVVEFLQHSVVNGNARLANRVKKTYDSGLSSWQVFERYAHRLAPQFSTERINAESEAGQKLLNLLNHWQRGII